jgi:sugar lactone lactonase YvrE
MQTKLLFDAKATLGEGPAWDEKSQTLYWVDILGKRVHAWKDGRDDFLQLDEFIGCVTGDWSPHSTPLSGPLTWSPGNWP